LVSRGRSAKPVRWGCVVGIAPSECEAGSLGLRRWYRAVGVRSRFVGVASLVSRRRSAKPVRWMCNPVHRVPGRTLGIVVVEWSRFRRNAQVLPNDGVAADGDAQIASRPAQRVRPCVCVSTQCGRNSTAACKSRPANRLSSFVPGTAEYRSSVARRKKGQNSAQSLTKTVELQRDLDHTSVNALLAPRHLAMA
jgi:hypothetical protein